MVALLLTPGRILLLAIQSNLDDIPDSWEESGWFLTHFILLYYNKAVPPIVVRIGRTWSEFGLFWEKGSEKGLNCLPKVRFGYRKRWKQVSTVRSSTESGRKRNYLNQFLLEDMVLSGQFVTVQLDLYMKGWFC
jgi:hypothetical protein